MADDLTDDELAALLRRSPINKFLDDTAAGLIDVATEETDPRPETTYRNAEYILRSMKPKLAREVLTRVMSKLGVG